MTVVNLLTFSDKLRKIREHNGELAKDLEQAEEHLECLLDVLKAVISSAEAARGRKIEPGESVAEFVCDTLYAVCAP